MAISSLLLAGVLAMGPQWSIVDLPYPEVKAPDSMGGYVPSTEAQVNHRQLREAHQPRPQARGHPGAYRRPQGHRPHRLSRPDVADPARARRQGLESHREVIAAAISRASCSSARLWAPATPA